MTITGIGKPRLMLAAAAKTVNEIATGTCQTVYLASFVIGDLEEDLLVLGCMPRCDSRFVSE